MRKQTKNIIGLFALATCAFSFNSYVHAQSNVKITINAEVRKSKDASPYLDGNQRTMVPIRFISEELGYVVDWDKKTKKAMITKDNKNVHLKVGSKNLSINGKNKKMDTSPVIKNGRVYIPLRFVGESLDTSVGYNSKTKTVELAQKGFYAVETERWGIYKNGTNAKSTTNGINNMLVWAKKTGKSTVYLPEGVYLIDKDSHLNMVSDITFLLNKKAVLQKEKNGKEGYRLMDFAPGTKNVTLRGGTYNGDKNSHDYYQGAKKWQANKAYKKGSKVVPPTTKGDNSKYYYVAQNNGVSGKTQPKWNWTINSTDNTVTWKPVKRATHEHGYGVIINGGENIVIDGVKMTNFTGDGMSIGKMGKLVREFYAKSFESGSIDENGKLIADSTKVRLTNLPITHPYFDIQRTFQFEHFKGLPKEAQAYVVYFYDKNGRFLSKTDTKKTNTPAGWGMTTIPKNAKKMNVVFNIKNVPNDIYLEYWMQGVSKNVTVKNSEFAFNRRQGITVGGAQNVLIANNKIHDMKGADPQSGIDFEAGYNLNNGAVVRNNHFYNNARYDLILYDGRNVRVEGNHFASKSIGLAISEPFKYATIRNNHFDGSSIYAYNYATFTNNKMNDSLGAFLGHDILIDGMEIHDSIINVASSKPYGATVKNVNVYNTKKIHSQFGVNRNPIYLENVTIKGQAALDSFSGNAADGSTFKNLKVLGYNRTALPAGTYIGCTFEAAKGNKTYGEMPSINKAGTYIFDKCSFTSDKEGMSINDVHSVPDKVVFKNSKFNLLTDAKMLSIMSGKEVLFENNTFNAMKMKRSNLEMIEVGNVWKKDTQLSVGNVTFKGNKFNSNLSNPISTIYAGLNAKSYTFEKNVLKNVRFLLKSDDVIK